MKIFWPVCSKVWLSSLSGHQISFDFCTLGHHWCKHIFRISCREPQIKPTDARVVFDMYSLCKKWHFFRHTKGSITDRSGNQAHFPVKRFGAPTGIVWPPSESMAWKKCTVDTVHDSKSACSKLWLSLLYNEKSRLCPAVFISSYTRGCH